MTEDASGAEPAEKAAQPVSTACDEQLIAMLVDRARGEGLQLSGEGVLPGRHDDVDVDRASASRTFWVRASIQTKEYGPWSSARLRNGDCPDLCGRAGERF